MSKPVEPCQASIKTLVLIVSRTNVFERRLAIRQTFANKTKMPKDVRLHFFVGNPYNETVQLELDEEHKQFGDVIQMDFKDAYTNLSLKAYGIFQWMDSYCNQAEFLLKLDDDTIVDFERLQFWIENKFRRFGAQHPKFYIGGQFFGGNVWTGRNKGSKWYLSDEQWPMNVSMPSYTAGSAVLLSRPAVAAILNWTSQVNEIPIDDVLILGQLADLAQVYKIEDVEHFRYKDYVNTPLLIKESSKEYMSLRPRAKTTATKC